MSEIGTDVARLLADADAAIAEENWQVAIAAAQQILDREPDDEDAAAIHRLATRRANSESTTRATTAERRQLTVMFVDVVGSTPMANRLDMEDMRDILLEYQSACGEVVEAYDGTIARYVGDGLLVYFGHPRAHEDDPRRAVLAGLAMASGVRRLADDVRTRYGVEFGARFGIHTGEVVLSDMGTAKWRALSDIVGPTPNLAARIEGMAPTNGVVMSAATAELVEGFVDLESLGPHEAKGFDQAIEIFQAVGATSAADRLEASGALTPFVGREAERRRLAEDWQLTVGGDSFRTFVRGEAGIGKSRLVHWLRNSVLDEGRCVTGRASAFETGRPFHVMVSAVLASLNAQDDDAELIVKKLDDQLDRLDGMPAGARGRIATLLGVDVGEPTPQRSPESLREETLIDLVEWFRLLAQDEPLLLAIEDLHWADSSSREALDRLAAARIGSFHLLATSRPDADPSWADETNTLSLGPLGPEQSASLIEAMVRRNIASVDETARATIVQYGDGIPLFLEELVRSGATDDSGHAEVPKSMLDLLMARLTALGDERDTASLLATIADEVPMHVLVAMSDTDQADVARHVDALVRAGLAAERRAANGSVLSFRHALQRDAAYASQLKAHRRERHIMLADRLPAETPEFAEQRPSLMAYHCIEASRPIDAVGYLEQAGGAAAATAAHAEAIGHFSRALELIEPLDRAPELDVLELQVRSSIGLASIISLGFTAPETVAHWERAGELVRALGSPPETYLAMWGVWAFHLLRADIDEAERLADEIDRMTDGADRDVRLFVETVLSEQSLYCGRIPECLEHSIIGAEFDDVDIAKQIANHPGIGTIANVGAMRAAMGDIDAGLAHAQGSIEAASRIPFPLGAITEAFCSHRVAWSAYQCGRYELALDLATRAYAIASEHGFVVWVGHGGAMAACAQAAIGDAASAIPMLRASIDGFTAAGARLGIGMYIWGLARAYERIDDPAQALATADEGLRLVDETHDRYLEPALLAARARAKWALGNDPAGSSDDAVAALETARSNGHLLQEVDAALTLHDIDHLDGVAAIRGCLDRLPSDASNPDIDRARALAV